MVSESDLAYSSGRKCGALVPLHMHTTTKLLRNTVSLELEGVRSSGKRGGGADFERYKVGQPE